MISPLLTIQNLLDPRLRGDDNLKIRTHHVIPAKAGIQEINKLSSDYLRTGSGDPVLRGELVYCPRITMWVYCPRITLRIIHFTADYRYTVPGLFTRIIHVAQLSGEVVDVFK